jgi:hypothetical protein
MNRKESGSIKQQVLNHIGKKVDIQTPEGTFEGVYVVDILFNRDAPFVITFKNKEGKTGFVYGGEGVTVEEVGE